MLRLAGVVAVVLAFASAGATAGATTSASRPPLLPACAYGASVPGLTGYEQANVEQDAWAYADALPGVSDADRTADAQTFAAAAAAYVYGLSLVNVHETVKRFKVRNLITSIDALSTPDNETTVSPNVDTAYTVGWIDLTSGPVVISVPNTDERFYTIQLMDAYSNSFSYIGSRVDGHPGRRLRAPATGMDRHPAGRASPRPEPDQHRLAARTHAGQRRRPTWPTSSRSCRRSSPRRSPRGSRERGVANVESSYPKSAPDHAHPRGPTSWRRSTRS